ncbi:MAG: hypothetical protein O7G85_16185 [Planctomycetota bacterium]|nr:hypothetical protein [Planctomycetota bacterium]
MIAVIRTGITSIVLVALLMAGYWQVKTTEHSRAMAHLEAVNSELEQKVKDHKDMVTRLSRSKRLAHIEILDQIVALNGNIEETTIRLIELDDDGGEIARQEFTIPGDMLFVDAWTVKFDHENIAQGHPLYGRTLVLLRRIYSDRMAPIDGFPIDTPGAIPPGYAVGEISLFEQKIWDHFWQLATDENLARSMEVRVAQGEAVYKPVRVNQIYELQVDASGGISLTPLAVPEDPVTQSDDST